MLVTEWGQTNDKKDFPFHSYFLYGNSSGVTVFHCGNFIQLLYDRSEQSVKIAASCCGAGGWAWRRLFLFRFLFKKVFMASLSSARIYIAPFLCSLFYWHLSYFLFLQLFLHELLTLPEIYVQKAIFKLLSSKEVWICWAFRYRF